MAELKGSLFLSIKELQAIEGHSSYKAAHREHQGIRDALGANKRKLTVAEYCNYQAVPLIEVIEFLNKLRY